MLDGSELKSFPGAFETNEVSRTPKTRTIPNPNFDNNQSPDPQSNPRTIQEPVLIPGTSQQANSVRMERNTIIGNLNVVSLGNNLNPDPSEGNSPIPVLYTSVGDKEISL